MTMQEIARIAGVHKSTVDKVIHNRPGVSEETRARIRQLLEENHYQPNRAAQNLQNRKKVFRIGVILLRVDAEPFLLQGIREGLKEYEEYHIRVDYHDVTMLEAERMAELLEQMTEEDYDGVILSPIKALCVNQALMKMREKKIPLVTVNSDVDKELRLCCVGQDAIRASQTAGRLMAECLGGKGKVAVVTSAVAEENNSFYVKRREKFFVSYLTEHYPKLEIVEMIESFENAETTRNKTDRMLKTRQELDGIYITCGGVADVAEMVEANGRAGKIKVIGYESYPPNIKYMKEDCVTMVIDSDLPEQGRLSVENLMHYLLYKELPVMSDIFTDIRILVKEMF